MNDEQLKRCLQATELSAPGIGFDEIMSRAERATRARPKRPLLRMAFAALAVWVMAWVAHAGVDRSIAGIAPMSRVTIADRGDGHPRGPEFAHSRLHQLRIMEELLAEDMGLQMPADAPPHKPMPEQPRTKRESPKQYPSKECVRRCAYV